MYVRPCAQHKDTCTAAAEVLGMGGAFPYLLRHPPPTMYARCGLAYDVPGTFLSENITSFWHEYQYPSILSIYGQGDKPFIICHIYAPWVLLRNEFSLLSLPPKKAKLLPHNNQVNRKLKKKLCASLQWRRPGVFPEAA